MGCRVYHSPFLAGLLPPLVWQSSSSTFASRLLVVVIFLIFPISLSFHPSASGRKTQKQNPRIISGQSRKSFVYVFVFCSQLLSCLVMKLISIITKMTHAHTHTHAYTGKTVLSIDQCRSACVSLSGFHHCKHAVVHASANAGNELRPLPEAGLFCLDLMCLDFKAKRGPCGNLSELKARKPLRLQPRCLRLPEKSHNCLKATKCAISSAIETRWRTAILSVI